MKYNISKKSLLMILHEIFTQNKKGKYFNILDEFHPGWSGLINLLIKSGYMNLNKKFNGKIWDNFFNLINYKDLNNISQNKSRDEILKKWNLSLVMPWTPFHDQNLLSLDKSLNEFLKTDYIKTDWGELESRIGRKLLINEKLFIYSNFTWVINKIFMLFGEINANSEFHGIEQKLSASQSPITGLIINNKDGSWDILHADIGSTIVKNIRKNVPEKVKNLSDKQIMKWATMMGNSSKSKNKYAISGGGITVLKNILIEDNSELFCISGNYQINFDLADNYESIKTQDDLVNVNVVKNKFYFPGTLWMFHINKPENIKKGIEDNVQQTIKENKDLRKRINKKVEEILKGYIIK